MKRRSNPSGAASASANSRSRSRPSNFDERNPPPDLDDDIPELEQGALRDRTGARLCRRPGVDGWHVADEESRGRSIRRALWRLRRR
jgi:hypothetical protein